ncbi:FtsX-like permease family protein [Pedobacter sp. HMF7647]|uniref:FtsX-like permease family protein n=1 Tax=Hufsiella arboris TaxID=2695275 RepID=A0A7K1YA87_9SPHI|nr:ABC transporter permease [Hufsiella arboris]MXV51474.1 FtsX-like permease family protein [Hufsiella arboris]
MLKNYIITAWRNLLKGRVFNLINITGLTVAVACSVLLFLTADFQLSYDKFHKDVKDIYQVYFTQNKDTETNRDTPMPEPITPVLKSEYPEIKYISRLGNGGALIRYKGKQLEQRLNYIDQDFFKIFTIETSLGNKNSMLSGLHDIVLNEKVAQAVFGHENPIGKTVELNYTGQSFESFVVSGVTKDLPYNSSLHFDMLVRFENYRDYQANLDKWDVGNHSVFLKLREGTNQAAFEKKLVPFTNKYFKENIENLKRDGSKPDANGQVFTINLLPFAENHFNTEVGGLEGNQISILYIYTLLAIVIFILLIACINFINLNIARAFNRAREVGVRKTLGAGKDQLLWQFLTETSLVCLLAFIAGIALSSFILPYFKQLFGGYISLKMLLQPAELTIALFVFLIISFIAGYYPAWLMLRYKTVQVLKGSVNTTKPGKVRNALLVTQFALSTLLIICTLVTWQQMRYIQTKPLGFNRTEVLSIPLGPNVLISSGNDTKSRPGIHALQLLRNALQNQPDIVAITAAHSNLGLGTDGHTSTQGVTFTYKGHEIGTNWLQVDYDYLKTLDIKLSNGRDFSRDFPGDSSALIINEKMARQLGGKNLLGSYLPVNGEEHPMQIVGIVKDYNFRSLKEKIEPLTLVMNTGKSVEYVFVRVKSQNLVQSFDKIKSTWKSLFPNDEFQGSWLSENTERLYKGEKSLGNMFVSGAIIAIIISCIGLLAIAMMVMAQRTKEIGIRKVLGSSVAGIVALVSADFLKLVLLASVISFPIAWIVMNGWLQNFAYRIDISWWIFLLAGLLAVLIAFATVSFQAIKAALANPVKSLRTE